MSDLAKRILALYQEKLQEGEKLQEAYEAEAEQKKYQQGKEWFLKLFHEEAAVDEKGHFIIEGSSETTSDKNPFWPNIGMDYRICGGDEYFGLLGICPVCQHQVVVGQINSNWDLGYYLSDFEIPYHDCPLAFMSSEPAKPTKEETMVDWLKQIALSEGPGKETAALLAIAG